MKEKTKKIHQIIFKSIICLFLICTFNTTNADAVTRYWDNSTGNGLWTDANNWTTDPTPPEAAFTSGVPTLSDTAVIDTRYTTAIATHSNGSSQVIGGLILDTTSGLRVSNTSFLRINSTPTLTAGIMQVNNTGRLLVIGDLTLNSGTTLSVSSTNATPVQVTGDVTSNPGSTLTMPSTTFLIGQNWSRGKSVTYNNNSGTVEFIGSANSVVAGGGFHNVVLNKNSTSNTLSGTFGSTTGDFTITQGTFTNSTMALDGNFTLEANGFLNFTSGSIGIDGDITVDTASNWSDTGGTLQLTGTTDTNFDITNSGTNLNVNNLTLNKTGASSKLSMADNITVNGSLQLTDGRIARSTGAPRLYGYGTVTWGAAFEASEGEAGTATYALIELRPTSNFNFPDGAKIPYLYLYSTNNGGSLDVNFTGTSAVTAQGAFYIYDGVTVTNGTNVDIDFQYLMYIQSGGVFQAGSNAVTVDHTLRAYINSGGLYESQGASINFTGGLTLNSGTFDHSLNTSPVTIDGTSVFNTGTFNVGSGTITHNASVTLTNGSYDAGTAEINMNNGLTINGANLDASTAGNFFIDSSGLGVDFNSGTFTSNTLPNYIRVNGDWDQEVGATFNHNNGELIMFPEKVNPQYTNDNGDQLYNFQMFADPASIDFPNQILVINQAMDVENRFYIKAGAVNIGTNNLNVAGQFRNSSGDPTNFIYSIPQTVTMDGDSQDIIGSTRFYNLTKVVDDNIGTTDELTLQAGQTQEFFGTLTLQGSETEQLILNSDTVDVEANIDPVGTRAIEYVTVKDNNNIDDTVIAKAIGNVDAGNNTNWEFPLVYYWVDKTGTVGTPENWNDASNWDFDQFGLGGSGIPDEFDTAIFTGSANGHARLNLASDSVFNLTIDGYLASITSPDTSTDFTIYGTYSQNSGTFSPGRATIDFNTITHVGPATIDGGTYLAEHADVVFTEGLTVNNTGVFNGNDSTGLFILDGGDLNLNAGSLFTSTQNELRIENDFNIFSDTNFVHNNGQLVFNASSVSSSINMNFSTIIANNCTFQKTSFPVILKDGTLECIGSSSQFTSGEIWSDGGNLIITGDLGWNPAFNGSDSAADANVADITFGSGASDINIADNAKLPKLTVNMSNTVFFGTGNYEIRSGGPLRITNGTVDVDGATNMTFNDDFIVSNGTFNFGDPAESNSITFNEEFSILSSGGTVNLSDSQVFHSVGSTFSLDTGTYNMDNISISNISIPITIDGGDFNILNGSNINFLNTLLLDSGNITTSGSTIDHRNDLTVAGGIYTVGNTDFLVRNANFTLNNGAFDCSLNAGVGCSFTDPLGDPETDGVFDFTILGGTFDAPSSNILEIAHNIVITGGTFNANNGAINLVNHENTTYENTTASPINSLRFAKSSGANTLTLNSNLDMNGTLFLDTGTFDVSPSNYQINIAGNWTGGGTFIPREGKVVFDRDTASSTQGITSSPTFYDIEKVATTNNQTLQFANGQTYTIQNNGIFHATSGNQLNVVSAVADDPFFINPADSLNISFQNTFIKDAQNTNYVQIDASFANNVDGGGNYAILFSTAVPEFSDYMLILVGLFGLFYIDKKIGIFNSKIWNIKS